MNKKNCWEFMKCGRQMGGYLAHQGVCPTATAVKLNGAHGGLLGGRACWVVQGTKCNGEVQGTFGEKYKQCENCVFYKTVMAEEGTAFILAPMLLERMKLGKTGAGGKPSGRTGDRDAGARTVVR